MAKAPQNTHFHPLKDASHTLPMEQPRAMDQTKVQTLVRTGKLYRKAMRQPCWNMPNAALANGEIDANNFQHIPT